MNSALDAAILAYGDLHCHLLPAWDDGPADVEMALKMAREAAQSGLQTIVVTPHVGRTFAQWGKKSSRDVPAATQTLQNAIDEAGIALKVVPGAEIMLGEVEILERVKDEPWLTVGGQGRYVLVESPFATWPDWGNNLLYELELRGVTPIVAHPERYANVSQDIGVLAPAVNGGALLQITAAALLGKMGRETKNCAFKLLESGWVSLVASDAHAPKAHWPAATATILTSCVGARAARTILDENPRRVLEGKFASSPQAERPVAASGWKKLLPWGRG